MSGKPLLYFICTGNSARSQMAEGFARRLLGDRYTVVSGGLEPQDVNPHAVAVMAEVGIDISGQQSKPLDLERLWQAQVVVTLCGDAEERCPVTPPHVRRVHWPLRDPARATGSGEEVRGVFRAVRDEIRERIEALAAELGETPRA
ncbi:MAG: arsenate reductase (thioredoxin) [Actinomycetia bacterium]|nr:arsenate reductase (thioredoxin) [Actinomycetes bacterium]